MELAPLRDQDDSLGIYWAASGSGGTGWAMSLLRSKDGGLSADTIDSTDRSAVIGRVNDPIRADGNPVPGVWDLVNTVKVRLIAGVLESVLPIQVQALQNIALVGSEILGFANAIQNTDGSWTLSTLLRGMQGTDVYINSHLSQEDFVLLDTDGSIHDIEAQNSDVGPVYFYTGLSSGATLFNTPRVKLAITGIRIKPLPVVHGTIIRDSATGNATIDWVPRRRTQIALLNGHSLGVDEPTEDYQVDVYDSTGKVARTLANWSVVTGTVGSVTGVDTGWRTLAYTNASTDGLGPTTAVFDLNTAVGGLLSSLDARDNVAPGGAKANQQKSSGKYYFELLHPASPAMVGLGLITPDFNIASGTGGHGVLAYPSTGGIFLDGVNVAPSFPILTGFFVFVWFGFAVDLDRSLFWVRSGPSGQWNGLAGADPVAGWGGVDISSMVGQKIPAVIVSLPTYNISTVANFGASSFSGVVPAGYTLGWPGPLPDLKVDIYQMSSRIGRGFPRTLVG